MKDKSFFIITYGCQMNDYDSGLIAKILKNANYIEVKDISSADVIIINTCCVRAHAEERALGRIRNLSPLRAQGKIIGVVGCMAQRLKEKIDCVDFVVGPSNYKLLPEIIEKGGINIEEKLETYTGIYPENNNVSAFVTIMRGCSNFCSYCIVPYVRGPKGSRDYKDILNEVDLLLSNGVKCITLLGQSVNEYEYDGVNFGKLLKMLGKKNIPILWFTSAHPKYIDDELIDTICELNIKWLHLPLQAGSNRILSLMNRKYTCEEYKNLYENIKKAIPDISITTDVIVGFPTETDEEFRETINLVKELRFDFAYMFKYSDREGTKAYYITPKVDERTKSERLTELINLQNRITKENNEKLIGKVFEVLVEGKSRRGQMLGRTRNNKVIVFEGDVNIGEFIKVKVNKINGWTPYGIIL